MPIKKRTKASTKRFGPRYGRRLKEKVAEIEKGHRGRHKCPYCGKKSAKRIALGIWSCKSCNAKFTGKAYSISKKIVIKEEVKRESAPKEDKKEEK